MLDETECVRRLQEAPEGAVLFVSYRAGRAPTERAEREAARACREGIARHHFLGTLASKRVTRRGEFVFTVLCGNRDNEATGEQQGYRSFNPSLGRVLSLEVIQ